MTRTWNDEDEPIIHHTMHAHYAYGGVAQGNRIDWILTFLPVEHSLAKPSAKRNWTYVQQFSMLQLAKMQISVRLNLRPIVALCGILQNAQFVATNPEPKHVHRQQPQSGRAQSVKDSQREDLVCFDSVQNI